MPDQAVAAMMRNACDLLMQADLFAAMQDLTPEALAQAMSLTSGIAVMPQPRSYVIESHEEVAEEQRFRVRFETDRGDVTAHAAWRQVDGAWKITSIQIEGLPES
jgi:hypothetical protein